MVAGTPIAFTRANNAIAKLELIGLLRNERGRCAIRNRIYKEALYRAPINPTPIPSRDFRAFVERLNDSDDIETLLQAATMQLQTVAQSRSVVALAVQPGRRTLDIVTTVGAVPGAIEQAPLPLEGSALDNVVGCAEPQAAGLSAAEIEWFRRAGAVIIVPVRLKDSIAALFGFGPKLSGEDYGDEERDFLTSLGDQTAAAIDRLRLRSLERDADKAWRIQRGLLPTELPRLAGFTIAGSCRPARVVSGDYYDAFKLSDHTFTICIGDVAGKGMPAALLMAHLQGTLKILATDTMTPSQLCGSLNQMLSRTMGAGEFITFFYGVLDTQSRRLLYANAGHNHPIVIRRSGDVVRLGDGGPVLGTGILCDASYADGSITLDPGDRLVLFTDGVVEARNHEGEEFGDDRLISIIRASADATDAHALLRGVTDALQQFSAGAFHDDVTLLAVAS